MKVENIYIYILKSSDLQAFNQNLPDVRPSWSRNIRAASAHKPASPGSHGEMFGAGLGLLKMQPESWRWL